MSSIAGKWWMKTRCVCAYALCIECLQNTTIYYQPGRSPAPALLSIGRCAITPENDIGLLISYLFSCLAVIYIPIYLSENKP